MLKPAVVTRWVVSHVPVTTDSSEMDLLALVSLITSMSHCVVYYCLKMGVIIHIRVAYFLIGSHTGHINIRLYQSSYSSYPPKLYISR